MGYGGGYAGVGAYGGSSPFGGSIGAYGYNNGHNLQRSYINQPYYPSNLNQVARNPGLYNQHTNNNNPGVANRTGSAPNVDGNAASLGPATVATSAPSDLDPDVVD